MLDLVPPTPEGVNNRVPMDFSQYLLSASPPSFGFDFMSLSLHHSQQNHHHPHGQTSPDDCQTSNRSPRCPFHNSFPHDISNGGDHNQHKESVLKLKSIIIRSDSYSSDSESESSIESPQSPGRNRKKVSFADHKGFALAQVRFVKESPDEPPQLDSKVLSLLTQGAIAGVTSNPPIKLCFPQPASYYMAFRDKILHNLISLENVILQDYTVKGTIKVKNITFKKRVFVRLSLDEWTSYQDHEAVFIPGPGNGSVEAVDTFSFVLEIPPSFDVSKKIQFAVCFQENGREHWDNNGNLNYCIVSDTYESQPEQNDHNVPLNPRWLPEKTSDCWSEFSVWRDVGSNGRYY